MTTRHTLHRLISEDRIRIVECDEEMPFQSAVETFVPPRLRLPDHSRALNHAAFRSIRHLIWAGGWCCMKDRLGGSELTT